MVINFIQDWSKYQLEGYHLLSPPLPESGCWVAGCSMVVPDECGMEYCVVLNPIKKDGNLWIRRPEDVKAVCPTLGAAQAALRLLQL